MALPKLYEQIVWHNNTTPAINEDNLNSMSQAIEDIDDRVIEIASTVMEDVPVIEERLEALDPPTRVVKDFAGVQALTDALDRNAVDVKIKITPKQAGSGTPSPDNIRAITGFTEAKVTRTGKNLLNNQASTSTVQGIKYTVNSDKSITIANTATAQSVLTLSANDNSLPAGTYIYSKGSTNANVYCNINAKKNNAFVRNIISFYAVSEQSFTLDYNGYDSIDILIYVPSGKAPNTTIYPMIRSATIADATYEAYTGTVFTISLGDTRYLAELDVTSGELIVKGTYTTLTSVERLLTNTSGQYRFASNGSYADAKIPSSNTQIATIYSSMFNAISADNTYAKVEGIALHTNRRIFLYSDAWKTKTAAEVNAILTDTPLQIVYELATPVTVQLTATEVALLYTYNTLWADTGDLALTYDASGVLRIANAKLDIDTFKSIVAASSDFADFKSKVAAL